MGNGFQALFGALPTSITVVLLLLTALLSYFLGCLNGAVLVSKYILQDDVRDHGSGNAGLTNFYRVFGGKLTLAVIAVDMVKMLIAVFFCNVIFSVVLPVVPIVVRYWAGLFCALGHMFPVMFQFRGGKGILSGGALALTLDWRISLIVWALFILIVVVSKLISLGSCTSGVVFAVSSSIVYRNPSVIVLALIIGLLILFQHRANLGRLATGKESKFSLSRKQVKP